MCGKIKVPGVLQYYPLFKQKLKHIEVIKKNLLMHQILIKLVE